MTANEARSEATHLVFFDLSAEVESMTANEARSEATHLLYRLDGVAPPNYRTALDVRVVLNAADELKRIYEQLTGRATNSGTTNVQIARALMAGREEDSDE